MATAHVIYHYEPEGWWAESPEFPGYSAFGARLDEVRLLAFEGLRFFAEDDTLNVVDSFSFLKTVPATTTAVEIESHETHQVQTAAQRRYRELAETGTPKVPA
jgi:predicted RNase H-like HicB family nuclease